MNTKNTKTAVIVLLIIANIFFVYNIISLRAGSENIPAETLDNTVSVLERNGLLIDRNKIPGKKPSGIIYEGVYEGSYPQGAFLDIIRSFSGISDDELEELKETGGMLGPDGISYSAGDYRFVFADGEESDYFRIGIIEESYTADTGWEETEYLLNNKAADGVNLNKNEIKKAEKIIKNFLKKYNNQDTKLGFEINGFEENKYKNCECVLIFQTFDGVPVDSHAVYTEIQDGKVKYFSGRWYFGEFNARYRNPLLDSVNILFKCIDMVGSGIESGDIIKEMNAEYNIIFHDKESFYLYPSWRLEFESGKNLSYNMISGDKN